MKRFSEQTQREGEADRYSCVPAWYGMRVVRKRAAQDSGILKLHLHTSRGNNQAYSQHRPATKGGMVNNTGGPQLGPPTRLQQPTTQDGASFFAGCVWMHVR